MRKLAGLQGIVPAALGILEDIIITGSCVNIAVRSGEKMVLGLIYSSGCAFLSLLRKTWCRYFGWETFLWNRTISRSSFVLVMWQFFLFLLFLLVLFLPSCVTSAWNREEMTTNLPVTLKPRKIDGVTGQQAFYQSNLFLF